MNLIVCCTPLQVLIAEKIISLYPDEDFYGVIITPVLNEKYKYYYKRLGERCYKTYLINIKDYSKKIIFLNALKIKWMFYNLKFHRIFISNINDIIIQTITSKFKSAELYTFDDGTINISSHNFESFRCESFQKKLARFFLGIDEGVDSIKKRSCLHYTIYPDFPNIIQNIKEIKILSEEPSCSISNFDTIRIMLGQAIFPDDAKNKRIIEKIIHDNGITLYFPHPLEKFYIENVMYIDTPLIFEDYLIKNFSRTKCVIYTFFSSAALNVARFNNVEVISLKVKQLENPVLLEIYNFFEKRGIKVQDYDG